MSKKTWWRWEGPTQFEHGRATYFCGTINEVSVYMPHFAQAHALGNAIEAQAKATRHDARYGLLQEIGRIEP